jgi:hypothetical protein
LTKTLAVLSRPTDLDRSRKSSREQPPNQLLLPFHMHHRDFSVICDEVFQSTNQKARTVSINRFRNLSETSRAEAKECRDCVLPHPRMRALPHVGPVVENQVAISRISPAFDA